MDVLTGFDLESIDDSNELSRSLRQAGIVAVLVASDLGDRPGVDLIRELVQRECRVPILLVTPSFEAGLSGAALESGASGCLDLSRTEGRELSFAIEFAIANRRSAERRHTQLLESLASYLSHEGRNALAGVRGAVQVVSDHLSPGSPDRVLCEEIQERVLQFVAALDSLTLVIRPLSRPLRAPVALEQVILEEAAGLPPGVVTTVTGGGFPIQANREQMRQLFAALLTNAAEAVAGAGKVEISLDRDGDWCVVNVVDTGDQLPAGATDLSHMLDLFTTSKGPRAGLGLPVAKRIAEAHGGTLELSCTPSCSVRATIRLPLVAPASG